MDRATLGATQPRGWTEDPAQGRISVRTATNKEAHCVLVFDLTFLVFDLTYTSFKNKQNVAINHRIKYAYSFMKYVYIFIFLL